MRLIGSRRAKPGEGKTAERLKELLAKKGYNVTFFIPALGFWRTAHADVHRWEAQALDEHGKTRQLASWDTMTKCVRNGIREVEVGDERSDCADLEVWANEDKPKQGAK